MCHLRNVVVFSTRIECGDRVAGFLFEPIQGEAGVCFAHNCIMPHWLLDIDGFTVLVVNKSNWHVHIFFI